MYNKYMPSDMEIFSDLYKPVVDCEIDDVSDKKTEKCTERAEGKSHFDLRRLLHRIDVEKIGILPVILLLLLLLDVDDEEKIIIIALAVIFGI